MPNIRIDREVYKSLQRQAEAFVDTPNSVLRRLLGLDPVDANQEIPAIPEESSEVETPAAEATGGAQVGKRPSAPEDPEQQKADQPRIRSKTHGRRARSRPRKAKRRQPPRLPVGVLLPEEEYTAPLLTALAERGGSAPAREIIDAVGKELEDRLTQADKEKISSGMVRWQNRVQFARLKLVEEGLLAKDSPRGVWALTTVGRARVTERPRESRVTPGAEPELASRR